MSPYPIQIEYYINNADNAFVNITNLSSNTKSIYLHAAIIGDNGLVARTKDSFRPLSFLTIPAFQSLFLTGSDLSNTDMGFNSISNLDILGVTPDIQDLIYIQRVLPAGSYQICITVLDWNTATPLQVGCSSEFTIYDASSPLIYQPMDGEVIEPNLTSNVQFAWWPPFTGASVPPMFKYRLKIIDITDNEYDDLDLEMNNPGRQIILDRDFIQEEFFMFDMTSAGITLDTGRLYAVRVHAQDLNGAVPVANGGFSEVITFRYGEVVEPEEDEEGSSSACDGYCEYELREDQTATTSITGMERLKIGFFEIQDLVITNPNGVTASGTGRIAIPFLDSVMVNVEFTGVKVNDNGRIFEGDAVAITDYDYDPNNPASISAWNQFVRTERLINTLLGARDQAFNLPVGMTYDLSNENFMLGFTQATFSPQRANCQVMHALNVQSWGENFISLSASDICLLPDGFGQQFIMHPPADIELLQTYGSDWFLNGTLASDEDQIKQEATYLAVDCRGVKEVGLRMEVFFTDDVLIPADPSATIGVDKVKGTISAVFVRNDHTSNTSNDNNGNIDFIGYVDIEPFSPRGFPDLIFEVNEAWYDKSDEYNPTGMVVPSNYRGPDVERENGVVSLDPTWEGFYLKSMHVSSRDNWPWEGMKIDANVENFIFDNLLTGNFYLKDFINTSNNNFEFTVDSFYFNAVQWSFEQTGTWEVGINGTIGIPLTSAEDDFRYSTILLPRDGTGERDIELIIQSPGGVTFPIMGNSPATLCPNSYIRVARIDGESIMDTHLAGNVSINMPDPISISVPWVDFHIGYHSNEGFTHSAFSLVGKNYIGEEVICDNVPQVVSIAGAGEHRGIDTSGNSSSNSGSSDGDGGGDSSNDSDGSSSSATASVETNSSTTESSSNDSSSQEAGVAGVSTSGSGDPLPPPPGASDPMGVNNFPIELKEINLNQISSNAISFDLDPSVDILGGAQNGLGIDVDLKIRTDFNASSKKFEFGPNSVEVGSVHLKNVNSFGVNLDGYVDFYNDNYGKGARGELHVDLPLGLEVDLSADFGVVINDPSVEFGTSRHHYGYWYVDGLIGFSRGIPLAPGVGLHGLGGGFYVNMERQGSFEQNNLDPNTQSEVNDILGSIDFNGNFSNTPDNYKPTPKYGSYGLKLATRLATTVPSALNMDVNISGTFAQGLGINSLGIYGDAYVMSPMDKREKANLWAFAGLNWSKMGISDHKFNGNISLFADVAGGVLRGAGSGNKVVDVSFEANTSTGKWFFKAGQPNDRAGLVVDLVLANLNANGYFMFGHDMPTTLPIPGDVERILGNASSNSKDGNKLDNQQAFKGGARSRGNHGTNYYEDGQGIAFGLEASVKFDLRAWALYASLNAYLGFDINLTRLAGGTCYVPGQGQISPGINDWYAMGQIYAGFEGALGLKGKFLGQEYNWELFSMGAAMIIQAGGPNPTWAEGRAGVYYRLLNGALKGHANFDLSVGRKCIPTYDSGMIPIVYKLTPEDGETDVSIFESRKILATFYVPVNEDIIIPHIDQFGRSVTKTVRIYIDDFKIESEHGTWGLNDLTQVWSSDQKAVTFNLNEVFLQKTDYAMTLTMKAEEKVAGQYRPYKLNMFGPEWPGEKHTHDFTTGEAPYPIHDSEILTTIPIRRQRFFMKEEMNNLYKAVAPVITFRQDLKSLGQSDYFPASTDKHQYTYYLRWQDLNGGEPIIQNKNYGEASSVRFVSSNIPELLPGTIYSCQLIRKTERIITRMGLDGEPLRMTLSANNLELFDQNIRNLTSEVDITLNATDTLTADIQMDPGQYAEPGEDIIYQFYFRTSKHQTLADKLAATTTSFENISTDLTDYPKVVFTMDERFDVFDVMGYFDNEAPFHRLIAPRVVIGAELNSNPTYYYSQNHPEIYAQDLYGIGATSQTMGSLGAQITVQGQASYNNFLNQSLIGFVHLHDELSATTHNVQAQRIRGTRPTPLELNNQTFPPISGLISKDYKEDVIAFSFGDAEIEGYLGPLADQNIQNAISASGGALGSALGTVVASAPLYGTNVSSQINMTPEFSTFKVAYKMPYWVYRDMTWAIMSGNDVFSRTTTRGSVYIPPLDHPGGDIMGPGIGEPTIGIDDIPQVKGPNSDNSYMYPFTLNLDDTYNAYTSDLTDYNIWTHYMDTYYPAFRVQLDNMGLNAKNMDEHKGNYKLVIHPDRSWLPVSLPTSIARSVLDFNYNPSPLRVINEGVVGEAQSGAKGGNQNGGANWNHNWNFDGQIEFSTQHSGFGLNGGDGDSANQGGLDIPLIDNNGGLGSPGSLPPLGGGSGGFGNGSGPKIMLGN